MRIDVERRSEARFECDQPAGIVNLTTGEAVEAKILNISGRGMQLWAAKRIAPSTPVRVDYGEMLLLGDVCHCSVHGLGFLYGIKLSHSLLAGEALTNLMKRVARQEAPALVAGRMAAVSRGSH